MTIDPREPHAPSQPGVSSGHDGIRISLKWMLILLIALGTGAGLLGRTFFRHPDVFRAIVMACSTIVPYILAILTLFVIGKRQKRRGLVLWASLLLVVPFFGFGLLAVGERYLGSAPGGLGVLTTNQIIQQRLPNQIEEPWVWQELQRRIAAGKLTAAEADAALAALVKHMLAKKPQGWDRPLNWQQGFLQDATAANLVSQQQLLQMCDAFYGKPGLRPLPRLRAGKVDLDLRLDYDSSWDDHSGLPYKLIWASKRMLVDGEPVKFENQRHGRNDWFGKLRGNLDAGDHEIAIEIDAAYIDRDKLLGIDTNELPAERWPQAAKRWTHTIKVPLKVFGTQEEIVKLTTDPKDDPRQNNAIQVERIVIQPQGADKAKVVLKLKFGQVMPVPVSFDAGVRLGDQDVHVGFKWAIRTQSRSMGGSDDLSEAIDPLDPSVTTADVFLTPNALHVEDQPEVEKIWGKPIVLRNIPLDRYDLQSSESSETR